MPDQRTEALNRLNAALGLGPIQRSVVTAPVEPEVSPDAGTDEITEVPEVSEAQSEEVLEVQESESESPEIEASEESVTGSSTLTEDDLGKMVELRDGREVPLSEALQGYMRTDHHTQSLQKQAQARNEYAKAVNMLQQVEQAGWEILAPDLKRYEDIDMEKLAYQDPGRYKQEKPIYDVLMKRAQAFQAKMGELQQDLTKGAPKVDKSAWEVVDTDLSYSVPGYNGKTLDELKKYAAHEGFTDAEVAAMADSRLWRMVSKAKAYDKLRSPNESATKRPASKRPGVKAARPELQNRKEQLQARSRAGDKEASLELLRGMINI
jgi:hypothetical protein